MRTPRPLIGPILRAIKSNKIKRNPTKPFEITIRPATGFVNFGELLQTLANFGKLRLTELKFSELRLGPCDSIWYFCCVH